MVLCKHNIKLICMSIKECIECPYNPDMTLDKFFTPLISSQDRETVFNKLFFCPFCLKNYLFKEFLQDNKKMLKCPFCHNEMLFDTIKKVLKMNAKQFAEFVYRYPFYEFWKKCKFETFTYTLNKLGISIDFLDSYKKWRYIES